MCNRLLNFVITVVLMLATVQSSSAQNTWARTYAGGGGDYFNEVHPTIDGGSIVIGQTNSFGAGDTDIWIVKHDSNGTVQWQKAIGSPDYEQGVSIGQTSDGGYFAAGTRLYNFTNGDIQVIRLDSLGNILWQKTYGGANSDSASSVRATADGGCIVTGATFSFGVTISVLVFKLNSVGSIQWQKTYADDLGMTDSSVFDIQQTSDGGYVFAGGFGDPHGIWVVRLDSGGNIVWQKVFTPGSTQWPRSVSQTLDGGFIIAANSSNASIADLVVLKLDSAGGVQWQKMYAGGDFDLANSVAQIPTGEYLVAGQTQSFGAGVKDMWILKLDSLGNVLVQKTYGGINDEYGFSGTPTSDGGYMLAGAIDTGTPASFDAWLLKLNDNLEISPNCPLASDTFASVSPSAFPQSTPALLVSNVTVTITDTTLTSTDSLAAVAEQCSGQTCIYCDDFEDDVLASDWTYLKPAWSESGGSLVATPVKKGVAIASPVFAGCSDCAFETDITIAGGQGNRVWILAWYTDKGNTLEVLLKEESDKIILKQKANGSLAAKMKVDANIDPNISYNIRIEYDGANFTLLIDGNPAATMPASGTPSGTIGLEAKNTTCRFGHVSVE